MPYATLSDADRDRIGRLNARNGYGLNASQLRRLCSEHKAARKAGDVHTMEKIEYRLTDINFHHECSLLAYGHYDQAMDELKNF